MNRPLHCVMVWFGGGTGLGVDHTVQFCNLEVMGLCGYPSLPILPDPPFWFYDLLLFFFLHF